MRKFSSLLLLVLLLVGGAGLTLLSNSVSNSEDPVRSARYQRYQLQRIDLYLLEALQQEKIDLWLVVTRENNPDPLAQDLFAHTAVLPAALFFEVREGKLRARVICANFDATPFEQSGVYEEVIPYGREGLRPHLKRLIEEINPKRIGVNISELEPLADGLSAGLKSYVEHSIGEKYAARMVSAQDVVSSFRSRKVPDEIALYREAVKQTIQLEEEALSRKVITPGVTTEIDVANYLRKRMIELNVTCAWGESGCPNVMAGAARGHSDASTTVIEPGRLVRIDFGIKIHGYCTDIQRMAYVLREGETEPPAEVQEVWETVLRANEAAVAAMRPGVTGVDVDTAARKIITDAGYDEFIHATGHPVGYFTHDIGPLTGPDWPDRYGDRVFRKLEAGQIHAIEPSVTLRLPWIPDGPVGVGLEEQVLVTADGAEYLGGHQTELILIR